MNAINAEVLRHFA